MLHICRQVCTLYVQSLMNVHKLNPALETAPRLRHSHAQLPRRLVFSSHPFTVTTCPCSRGDHSLGILFYIYSWMATAVPEIRWSKLSAALCQSTGIKDTKPTHDKEQCPQGSLSALPQDRWSLCDGGRRGRGDEGRGVGGAEPHRMSSPSETVGPSQMGLAGWGDTR